MIITALDQRQGQQSQHLVNDDDSDVQNVTIIVSVSVK